MRFEEIDAEKPPCAHGTYAVINAIYQNINTLPTEGVLINLQTLLRNIYSDDATRTAQQCTDLLKKDIGLVVELITPLIRRKYEEGHPFILFYLMDYYHLMQGYKLRPDTEKTRAFLSKHTATLLSAGNRVTPNGQIGEINEVKLYGYGEKASRNWPDTILFRWLSAISSIRSITMISHQPLDWHLSSYVSNFTLVESYTGRVVSKQELGQRCFGTDYQDIPFCHSTHLLMGDKHLVEGVLTPSKKKELLQQATKEHWKHQSAWKLDNLLREQYKLPK